MGSFKNIMNIKNTFNTIKPLGALILMLILMSCPGNETDCFDFGSTAEVPDLIQLTPAEQTTYTAGDEMVLKVSVPATNTYYGIEKNLYALTGDNSARLIVGFTQPFIDNQLTFIKGSQSEHPNWFNMPYNAQTDMYELEVKITLNRIGDYSFTRIGDINIQGGEYCNRFRIDTNVNWFITNGKIEFTVQ